MSSLLTAVGLFLAAFAAHLVVWRIRIPRRQTGALVLIFALVPALACGAACALGAAEWVPPPADLP